MSLGKVKDVIECEHIGKVVKLKQSKDTPAHWYLIIKHNAEHWYKFLQFVRLPHCNVYYWDSMLNDEVLNIVDMEFLKLLSYIPEEKTKVRGK